MKHAILYAMVIALLLVILGEVVQMRQRIEMVYNQIDELDMVVTGGLVTGKVGEEVR